MRKFNVNVNGNSYVVEVEELTAGVAVAPAPVAAPVAAPAPVASVAPAAPVAPVAKPAAVTGGTALKCPMPGKVLKLVCKDGDTVTKNQKVAVLEAMKMENDIVSPADGVITYMVKEGEDLDSQQTMAVIK